MKINRLKAFRIEDTRGESTIDIRIDTDWGIFNGSAPNGKSRGKYEARPWKINLSEDIKFINKCDIRNFRLEKFDDLKNIEIIFWRHIGANTMIALEYAFLKAMAAKQKKEVWQLINPKAGEKTKKFPMPVGNAIGGGAHSKLYSSLGPRFQEFHFIPDNASFEKAVEINKRARENCAEILANEDKRFVKKANDENAWETSFNDEQVINVLMDVKENMIDEFGGKIHCGMDVAASEFFESRKYEYKDRKKLGRNEQIKLMIEYADKLFYIEDPLEENDFEGFAEISKKAKGLIVGDDLTATNFERIKLAYKKKAINGLIIKPNQNGSLMELKKIVEFCKKFKIKMIFSHRSGETSEDLLADLAFGFQADFIKTGICGKGRDEKLDRMIEIERSLMKPITKK